MLRNYAREYKNYQGLPKSIKERASRNKARKIMVDKLGAKACKNKHIDHVDHNPMNNKLSNLRLRNPSVNMADNVRKSKSKIK